MDFELLSVIIFYLILGYVIYRNRKKMEILDKIFFVFRWKKGAEYIKKISKPVWMYKILSTISIPICLFFVVFSVSILLQGAYTILNTPEPSATVSILIPGVTNNPATGEPFPIFQTILVIVILAIFHEASHGIISIVEGMKLKSTGAGLLLFLPLAFVEPDEKSYAKSSVLSRIRMLCAGSFANLTIAFLSFLLVVNILNPFVEGMINYTNVVISSALPETPAGLAGVPNNSKLLMINDNLIQNITTFYLELLNLAPGENISLITNNGTYYLTTAGNPSNNSMAYLGVMVEQKWEYKPELLSAYPELILSIPLVLINFFMLLSNLNFAVGVFNLFPLWITDGGKVIIELVSLVIKDKKLLYLSLNLIFFSALSLLLFNMFGPFFINIVQSLIN